MRAKFTATGIDLISKDNFESLLMEHFYRTHGSDKNLSISNLVTIAAEINENDLIPLNIGESILKLELIHIDDLNRKLI